MAATSSSLTSLIKCPLSDFELDLSGEILQSGLDGTYPYCTCGGDRIILSTYKRKEYVIRKYRCKECGSINQSIEINADAFMDLVECVNWKKGNGPH